MKMKSISVIAILFALIVPRGYTQAQSENKMSFMIPEGAQYSIVSNDDNGNRQLFIRPNGEVWIATGSKIYCEHESVEFPPGITPTEYCWTSNDDLAFFYRDTIYLLDSSTSLKPLAIVESRNIKITPFDKSNFLFCSIGDTVIYSYNLDNNSVSVFLTYSNPITDFTTDKEDVFFSSGNHIIARLKEELYMPILQNTLPIKYFSFCGSKSIFLSDSNGLWMVDNDRNKYLISNQQINDIITDNKEQGLFKLIDGSWIYVYPLTKYELSTEKQ